MARNLFTEDSFDEIFKSISSREIYKSLNESFEDARGLESYATDSTTLLGPQKEYVIQSYLRSSFDKPGLNTSGIAQHPDFMSLVTNGKTINQYVSTLFIDIKGSTRLSLLYDLNFIYNFKNAVLQACIEVVRSFDGYVHRLMGDALMAFFGSKSMDKEQAAIDSINCSLICKMMLETAIKPWLERQKNFDISNFGFRIGCNFGDDHEVLWGNYGFGELGEISPTGLPVDLAAKLQGLASKNEIMIGQGIIDFLCWPEEYSEFKRETQNGVETPVKFITPNYTKRDGSDLNYKMRLLDYNNCIEYLPIPPETKRTLSSNKYIENSSIKFSCDVVNPDKTRTKYTSGTKFLEKNLGLVFTVEAVNSSRLKFPLNVLFKKRNHGPDVPSEKLIEVSTPKTIKKSKDTPYSFCTLDEGTSYRGLHTMGCEVRDAEGSLVYRNKIAILIK